eukprot:TRINITY_DN76600_c0_g1_i1.p2 TRINITY_DN76600_c0_g1~~TRINITY_DN76600_c0_g1_i1.p2  ORF type:complete len:104 (+),score=3.17 TRINITY_DN76600_c0_g1_i1:3-314(+)
MQIILCQILLLNKNILKCFSEANGCQLQKGIVNIYDSFCNQYAENISFMLDGVMYYLAEMVALYQSDTIVRDVNIFLLLNRMLRISFQRWVTMGSYRALEYEG